MHRGPPRTNSPETLRGWCTPSHVAGVIKRHTKDGNGARLDTKPMGFGPVGGGAGLLSPMGFWVRGLEMGWVGVRF